MKTFKLHLIRHGLTSGNLQGLYIGSGTDIPLCDEGRAQLAELKELVMEIDKDAFVIVQEAHQVLGDGFKRYSKSGL